jgi:hypothetical protein
MANGTHLFRGVEVTENGALEIQSGSMIMQGNDKRPPLLLEPMQAGDKVQWDATARAPKPLDPLEQAAYETLLARVEGVGGSMGATVTGPLKKSNGSYVLEVRQFSVP